MQLSDDKKQKIYDKALGAIKHWLERFDTIIIGPGLGRDEMVHYVVKEVSSYLHSPVASIWCMHHKKIIKNMPCFGRYQALAGAFQHHHHWTGSWQR